jgi:hypothetical protein
MACSHANIGTKLRDGTILNRFKKVMENTTVLKIGMVIKLYSISVRNSSLILILVVKKEIDMDTLSKEVIISANHSLHPFLRAQLSNLKRFLTKMVVLIQLE